jgi:septum formation protein
MYLEKLILASKSPRRVEILNAVGWPFEAVVAGIDESRHPDEDAVTYVRRLALGKASKVAQGMPHGLVLGADTVVVVEGEILGQPHKRGEAKRMLNLLNGRWHDVVTGVALIRIGGESLVEHATTRVRFSEMTEEEIDWYVSTDEPLDKAGAYAIQGKAALFIEEIEGEYLNIVGLPIRLVYEMSERIRMKDEG